MILFSWFYTSAIPWHLYKFHFFASLFDMKNFQAFCPIKNGSYIQNETLDPRIHKVTEVNKLSAKTYAQWHTDLYPSHFRRKWLLPYIIKKNKNHEQLSFRSSRNKVSKIFCISNPPAGIFWCDNRKEIRWHRFDPIAATRSCLILCRIRQTNQKYISQESVL